MFSLNSLGTRKRLQLINEWKQQRENLAPKKNLSFERPTLNEEDDSQSFDFSVDFPDTNTAKNLKYYTDDRVNVSLFESSQPVNDDASSRSIRTSPSPRASFF